MTLPKTIHAAFIEAFNSKLPVMLDIVQVTDADVTFIQLLRSLCYSMITKRNCTLEFNNNELPVVLKGILAETGFVCREECVRAGNVMCICNKLMNIHEFKLETME